MHYLYYSLSLICMLFFNPLFSQQEEPKEQFFISTPEQLATLQQDSSYLVGDLISPLSGQLSLRKVDLVAKGAESIRLSRIYIPPHIPSRFPRYEHRQKEWDKYHFYKHLEEHYQGWQFYPHLRLELKYEQMEIVLTEPSGMSLEFRLSGPDYTNSRLISAPYGLSNSSGSNPHGSCDPRNTRISYDKAGTITIYATDGTTRYYSRRCLATSTSELYLLDKEILANGKRLRYTYNSSNNLTSIESLDPEERFVYATLQIRGCPAEESCSFVTSTGLSAQYNYQKKALSYKAKEVDKHWYGDNVHWVKGNSLSPPILSSVCSPLYENETIKYCDKFLLNSYSDQNTLFNTHYETCGKRNSHYRVKTLSLPLGEDECFIPVYELDYDPAIAGKKEGATKVTHLDGTSTLYHFSKQLLTTLIQYFDEKGELKKEKAFFWDEQNWLIAIEMRDGDHKLLYRKSYQYDCFGNPILEQFSGDQTFTIKRQFSNDGRHLLLREESDDGKILSFTYLPGTNLITSKLREDGACESYLYDNCNNLIETVADDGAGQIIRTRYQLRESAPFLHMPEWIITTYQDNGSETLLNKRHFIYDGHGNVHEEEFYGADERLAYTLYKNYNERGDLLTETNASGAITTYTYDAKGRPLTSSPGSKMSKKQFRHDLRGRLIQQIEEGDEGTKRITTALYNAKDQLIQKTDPRGNSAHYEYDKLSGEIIKTHLPGDATTHCDYDAFGRKITSQDANGNTTYYSYNAYGLPVEILHSNNSKELFTYAANGALLSHTDRNGTTTHYERDTRGRVVIKWDDEGEEHFLYKGAHLIQESDKEGNQRYYSYDGAGRKISEEYSGARTTFTYDALGWLETVTEHNGNAPLVTRYKRDLEGYILEKSKCDLNGCMLYKIAHAYDASGNCISSKRYIDQREAIQTFRYDPFNRLIEEEDSKGYRTQTSYREDGSLTITRIDPAKITTIETKDALGRTIKIEQLNAEQETISAREMIYDPHGNLLSQKDHLYEKDHYIRIETVQYSYTADNQVASFTKAFDSPHAETTSYTYYPSGKVESKTLPSGVTLFYSYNPCGQLIGLTSSDDTISHTFQYNRLGHLIHASDEKNQISVKREVDPFGNVLCEIFPSEAVISKKYDALNRVTSIQIDNQGSVQYDYDALNLRSVARYSANGQLLYEHHYTAYDLDGNLLSEQMLGELGTLSHTTDLRGQKQALSSPYFSEECQYDCIGNRIGTQDNRYTYDDLSQLTSEITADGTLTYNYDSLYHRLQNSDPPSPIAHYIYDPLDRLIEATTPKNKIRFLYDPLGRCLQKTIYTKQDVNWVETSSEYYLYHGMSELGAFNPKKEPISLKILGLTPIAIELNNQLFAPISDIQGNICCLIDPHSKKITEQYRFTAFGEEAQDQTQLQNPWRYAAKRHTPELNLIYFGHRYYDPAFGHWLTPDPAGFHDSTNLYQYLFNNPFRYKDPDGRFVIVLPLLALSWELIATVAITAYVAYELEQYHHHQTSPLARGINSALHSLVQTTSGAPSYMLNETLDIEPKKSRSEPKDLSEQLALEEAKAKQRDADDEIMSGKIKDPNYPREDWKKVDHIHEKPDNSNIDIHYWENRWTGEKRDFKFKND